MKECTFLTSDQVFNLDGKQLDILKQYGCVAAITDFSILLGGYCGDCYTSEGESLENRAGWWWMQSPSSYWEVRAVS